MQQFRGKEISMVFQDALSPKPSIYSRRPNNRGTAHSSGMNKKDARTKAMKCLD